ncbi:uncharacterized protein LAESUDRAFT_747675 [Laetiporus sulphureus 93-53]|uniref:Protein kinase domain-containing protein n=1 Tax=Laetiporus sulphureus 93-53 TaxID=1314785 RepID=A0A165GFD9_9APHY|nr:uncharacterized protein LAESUDRAFT_747675 [Laetiporus sulphureus 93-53]KZT10273.1 hypothetical protein LAESUDRAFT_747675 [Laetiporus sulphureus 93-53]
MMQESHPEVALTEKLGSVQAFKRSCSYLVTLYDFSVSRCGSLVTGDQDDIDCYNEVQKWCLDVIQCLEQLSKLDTISLLTQWQVIQAALEELYDTCPVLACPTKFRSEHLHSSLTIPFQPGVEETLDVIQIALSSRDSVHALLHLDRSDTRAVINLLDQALEFLEWPSRLHSTASNLLRKLCIRSASLPDSLEISEENITRHHDHAIDGGGFADIWLGTCGRITVALKVFRVFGKDDAQVVYKKFCKEAIQWKRLCHPNITPFLGVNTTLFPLCLISEWMPNGNVNAFLKKRPNANRLELLVDVAKGLEYLHTHGLFHGDLKGANVLVDETSHARLSDFGLAAVIYDSDTVNLMTTSSCDHGSIRWMAPELLFPEQVGLKSARQTFQSDVYSLAMVMWEIFTGRMPFHEIPRDPAVVYQVTMLGTRPKRPPDALLLGLSDAVWLLMELCWRTDRRERPMMAFVVQQLTKAIEDYLPDNEDAETTERLRESRLHDSSSTRVTSIMRHSYDAISLPTGFMSKTALDSVPSASSNANDPGSSSIRINEEKLEHIRDNAQLLIETERKYVHGLEVLQNYSKEAFLTDSASPLYSIFSALDIILAFQRKVLTRLEITSEAPWLEQRWGFPFVSKEHEFEAYEAYFIAFPAVECFFKDTHKAKMINNAHDIKVADLPMLLIKPLHRMREYPALLKSLSEAVIGTAYAHYPELQAGVRAAERISDRLHKVYRSAKNTLALGTVQKRLIKWEESEISQLGSLLLSDFFTMPGDKDDGLHAFLFERSILLCKELPRLFLGSKRTRKRAWTLTKPKSPTQLPDMNARLTVETQISLRMEFHVAPYSQGQHSLFIWWKGDSGSDDGHKVLCCQDVNQLREWEEELKLFAARKDAQPPTSAIIHPQEAQGTEDQLYFDGLSSTEDAKIPEIVTTAARPSVDHHRTVRARSSWSALRHKFNSAALSTKVASGKHPTYDGAASHTISSLRPRSGSFPYTSPDPHPSQIGLNRARATPSPLSRSADLPLTGENNRGEQLRTQTPSICDETANLLAAATDFRMPVHTTAADIIVHPSPANTDPFQYGRDSVFPISIWDRLRHKLSSSSFRASDNADHLPTPPNAGLSVPPRTRFRSASDPLASSRRILPSIAQP